MEELTVRRYRSADHDEVWQLHNLALRQVEAHAGNGPWDEDLHKIEEVYLENKGEFLVAELDGEIVGMGALLRKDRSTAEVRRMRVAPECQGEGVGKLVLDKLQEKAREYGYRKLVLDTTTKQVAAQRLYLKNGFKEVERTQAGGFKCIHYEKELE